VFRKGKASTTTLSVSFIICPTHELSSVSFYKGGDNNRPIRFLHFCRLMPKGEKLIGPMQKDRTTTTTLFSKNFFKKEGENIQTIKTLSTAKGRTPSGGDFLFNQRKSI
jgi:hypothetical protein